MSYRLHRGSVLPRVDLEQTAEGTLVRAVRPTAVDVREVVLYAIAFLMLLAAALASRGGMVAQVIRVVNACGVFMIFLGMLTQLLRRRRLFKGTLLVRPWPIRLGDSVTLRFRAMLRRSAPVSSLAARLRCTEEVTIGRGRGQRKESAVAFEIELSCSSHERQVVEEEWTFTILPSLPPSLEVPANRVEWRLSAILTTKGVDIPADFILLVIPEVVE